MIELDEDEDFEPGRIVSVEVQCAGGYRCPYKTDEEKQEHRSTDCIWCDRWYKDAMGREWFEGPGEA